MELPADLAAAIAESPDVPEVRLVAADWLQHRGDPQGELIALSVDGNPMHAARIAELQHELDPVTRTKEHGWHLGWRWGFVQRISHRTTSDPDAQTLADLLASPVARFVGEIALDEVRGWSLDRFTGALAGSPRTLRGLTLQASDPFDGDEVAELEALWPRLPALEHLVLRVPLTSAALVLPELVELSLVADHAELVASLGNAHLPRLRTLRLSVPHGAALATVLPPARFPALRHLTVAAPIDAMDFTGLRSLAIAAQLETLETVNTSLAERDARRFPISRGSASSAVAGLLDLGRCASSVAGRFTPVTAASKFRVGRSPDCNLRLGDVGPGKFAAIDWAGAGWWLREVQPETRLNGHWLPNVELRTGDELQIGLHVFRFVTGDLEPQLAELRARFALP